MRLLPAPVAVVDFETTGLFPGRSDRIIEIAAVVIGTDGRIEREFETLVNPERDIGPTSIHGITSEDVLHAPTFAQIARMFLDHLDGCIAIGGHNVSFERLFLWSELGRLGCEDLEYRTLCTLAMAGGSLSQACSDYNVTFEGTPHQALNDARANAKLIVEILKDEPAYIRDLFPPIPFQSPTVPRFDVKLVTRADNRIRNQSPPNYLQRLIELAGERGGNSLDGAELAYADLLGKVLEDRRIDEAEEEALVELAGQWGLRAEQIRHVHREFLGLLSAAAIADGVVTESEMRDLQLVARLLGIPSSELVTILDQAKLLPRKNRTESFSTAAENESLAGKRVCFTGELMSRVRDKPIDRETASILAEAAGLVVVKTVNKKLDLLVVADPHSQSGKAKMARQYGTRIIHEPVFWSKIGVKVT